MLYSTVLPLQALLTKTAVYTRELNPRSRMAEVEVRVPRHWDWRLCDAGGRRRSAGGHHGPARGPGDIVLGPSHPQFGSHPWTLAHRGCGHRGLLINLPVAFVVSPSLDTNVRGKAGLLCVPQHKMGWFETVFALQTI